MAAAVEALRAIRDAGFMNSGSVLLTAHDLHEAPWGDGRQLDQLIREGIRGDAVLLPEPLCNVLPVAGRGSATWKVIIRRPGAAVHEVMRPRDEPSVIAAAAELILRLGRLDSSLAASLTRSAARPASSSARSTPARSSTSIRRNAGSREPGAGCRATITQGRAEFRARLAELAIKTRTRGLLRLDDHPRRLRARSGRRVRASFQECYHASSGSPLPEGPKPFVDDGNSFWALAGIPAITHGPRAGGQHTVSEWVEIDDLVRVAKLYAATAVIYCHSRDAIEFEPDSPVPARRGTEI